MVLVPTPLEKIKRVDYSQITKQDFFSGLINNGELIVIGSSTTTNKLIYQVPGGKTLFIISSSVIANVTAGALNTFYIYIENTNKSINWLPVQNTGTYVSEKSYTIPLKVQSTNRIYAVSSAGHYLGYGLIGYLVQNSLIPNFL